MVWRATKRTYTLRNRVRVLPDTEGMQVFDDFIVNLIHGL